MLKNQSKWNLAAIAALAMAVCLATPVHAQSEADCAARADRAQRESNSVLGGAAVGAKATFAGATRRWGCNWWLALALSWPELHSGLG